MKLIELIANKRVRNPILLSLLVIIFLVVLYVQFFSQPKPDRGAMRVVQCSDSDCKHTAVKKIMDIGDSHDPNTICEKCGKPVGYAFKCEDCDFEFSVTSAEAPPPKAIKTIRTMGKFHYALEMQKCPNCGSIRTYPVSVDSQ